MMVDFDAAAFDVIFTSNTKAVILPTYCYGKFNFHVDAVYLNSSSLCPVYLSDCCQSMLCAISDLLLVFSLTPFCITGVRC